jgi:hypothetical protein
MDSRYNSTYRIMTSNQLSGKMCSSLGLNYVRICSNCHPKAPFTCVFYGHSCRSSILLFQHLTAVSLFKADILWFMMLDGRLRSAFKCTSVDLQLRIIQNTNFYVRLVTKVAIVKSAGFSYFSSSVK